jgi:hypothetical protein
LEDLPKLRNKDDGYFLFLDTDEKVLYEARGVLEGTIDGNLILTSKKLFFYFMSNISRDKQFIATHPFIASADLKEGIISSTLTISNKKVESFKIKKINKNNAKEFYILLNKIISKNSK